MPPEAPSDTLEHVFGLSRPVTRLDENQAKQASCGRGSSMLQAGHKMLYFGSRLRRLPHPHVG